MALSSVVAIVLVCAAFLNPSFGQVQPGPYGPPTPPPMPPPEPPMVRMDPPPLTPPPAPKGDFRPPVVVPTDVESTLPSFQGNQSIPPDMAMWALEGVNQIQESQFPKASALSGSPDGLVVKEKAPNSYKRLSDLVVDVVDGEVLVSVRKPSKTAMVNSRFGSIALSADSDILVVQDSKTVRIMNLTGIGRSVKVQLNKGPFSADLKTVTIKPGFELVASSDKLSRSDMRPQDGIARRHFKILEAGRMAISEFSLESVMKANDIIANLRQESSGVKERRILGDMSKMAAVLNHRNGTQGFTIEE